MNIIQIIILGLSLAMDTFSLSISLGTMNIDKKKYLFYSLIVGFFHFILPITGHFLSKSIENILTINTEKLFYIILIFIMVEMIINFFSKEEKYTHFYLIDMLICAISVSIDSFTIGIGLFYSSKTLLLCSFTFLLFSTIFTIMGFKIGQLCKYKLGKIAEIIGVLLLFLLMIVK